MKTILLIMVGGTICTELNTKGNLSVGEKAGALLKVNYEESDSPYAKDVAIDISENLFILSENMTVANWNLILDTYRKYSQKKKYDGIILAHGTDTLAYSSSVFSMLLSDTDIPVFFVSANEPLSSPRSNGNDNFRCAMECICRGITPNVYVTYKNLTDGQMYLHLASRLRQCENYSDDFYSVGAVNITDISEQNYSDYFQKIEQTYPVNQRKSIAVDLKSGKLKECILVIDPYVGLNYDVFRYEEYSAVLHGTYHSGTACAQKSEKNAEYDKYSILYMLDRCFGEKYQVDVYFSPSVLARGTYETVSIIGEHEVNGKNINFLYGYTREMAYAKLLIAYSFFEDAQERRKFIETEYNFERIAAKKQ